MGTGDFQYVVQHINNSVQELFDEFFTLNNTMAVQDDDAPNKISNEDIRKLLLISWRHRGANKKLFAATMLEYMAKLAESVPQLDANWHR